MESHTDIKIKAPIGLCRDHTGVHPEILIPLVLQREITLRLARNIFHRTVWECAFIKKCEFLIDTQGPVDPMPRLSVFVKFEPLRIIPRL